MRKFGIMQLWRTGLLLLLLACAGTTSDAAPPKYRTDGTCDGYPRLHLTTPPGLCVGLVADGLGFARGVAAIGDTFYVVDMGGWQHHRGRLLALKAHGGGPPTVLLDRLDEPSSLIATPAGTLYIATLGAILSIDPRADPVKSSLRTVVDGLPGIGLHPLAALALVGDGSLYLGLGSVTDHCETASGKPPDPAKLCAETEARPPRGAIYRLTLGSSPVDLAQADLIARGLRNPFALAVLPGGALVAAVNARDHIDRADPRLSDEELPHDTLDWIESGADYGWPYCFDLNRPSPEYPAFDCSTKHLPTMLLPPHAAPLGLFFYRGEALPPLAHRLIIAYHGYRKLGHRIVGLQLDAADRPVGEPVDLVSGWETATDSGPRGAPVTMTELPDGSVLVTEDHNGTLLRLARTSP